MQPYLFPYIGYFQLIAASELFVSFDTAAFTKHRWINRNRILVNGAPHWLTLPVVRASHTQPILERTYKLGSEHATRLLRCIAAAYRSAPQFDRVYPMVQNVLTFENPNVAAFNINALTKIMDFVGIKTPIAMASDVKLEDWIKGEERVVAICRHFNASAYINPIGGSYLYRSSAFAAKGIDLRFLRSRCSPYAQLGQPFVPSLSIIDTLMFNDSATTRAILQDYDLTGPLAADASKELEGTQACFD
jgi:hypothetical protein